MGRRDGCLRYLAYDRCQASQLKLRQLKCTIAIQLIRARCNIKLTLASIQASIVSLTALETHRRIASQAKVKLFSILLPAKTSSFDPQFTKWSLSSLATRTDQQHHSLDNARVPHFLFSSSSALRSSPIVSSRLAPASFTSALECSHSSERLPIRQQQTQHIPAGRVQIVKLPQPGVKGTAQLNRPGRRTLTPVPKSPHVLSQGSIHLLSDGASTSCTPLSCGGRVSCVATDTKAFQTRAVVRQSNPTLIRYRRPCC